MARRHALVNEDRHGGKRKRRLGDIVRRLSLELGGKGRTLLPGCGRADQHAVAAGAVHLLDDQFLEMLQHVFQAVGLGAAPGRHVFEKRLAAGVELDDFRHVGIDRLVVGNSGARRIGDRDVAGTVDIHDARNAERGIRPEGQRIEEIVVDAAVEHVDRLVAAGGAHLHLSVDDPEVRTLDELDAHHVGEEGMFIIGGIVDARR